MHMIIDRFSGFLLTLVERLRVLPENQLTRPSEQTPDVNLLNLQFAEKLYKFVERECLTKVLGPVTKAVALVLDLNDEDM